MDNDKKKRILIIAGGSGGHVFPGLTIAGDLISSGFNVVWLGTADHIESKLVPKYGINIKFVRITGWRDKRKLYMKVIVLIFICIAIYQSRKIIKYWKPDIVLGMGGYITGPGGIAAWMCGIPLIIHEQNRIVGLTNRYLSFFAKQMLLGFSSGTFSNAKIVGNPIRREILSIPHPMVRWKNRTGPIRVLVIGGSKGARILNTVMPDIAAKLCNQLIVWHQVGEKDLQNVIYAYQQRNKQNNYKIVQFIDDMAHAYAWADILISRAGALTVSEMSIVGLPAIFVPFIYHQDRQQYWNALPLVQAGAAKIIEQKDFTVNYVSTVLSKWNRKILLNMALCAKDLAQPGDVTQKIVQIITKYLKK